jgi:hypothetical protein
MMFALGMMICLISCEKEPENPGSEITNRTARGFRTNKDVRTPKEGEWQGENTFDLPNVASKTMPAWRRIQYLNDSLFKVQWYSHPDTFDLVTPCDTMRYEMVFDQTNTTCGIQRTIWQWNVTAFMVGDTLCESGTIYYQFYYYGILRKESIGSWSSKVTWKRKVHF